MNRHNLYPYLVPALAQPDEQAMAVPIGHGIFAVLREDQETPDGLTHRPIALEDLQAAGLSVSEAHKLALENLIRFADDDPHLSIQVLGRADAAIHLLLYSDHPRAASCLLLPDLYEQARELLGTDELCACVPQPESLVVFPKRDHAYREMVIRKVREIEGDAPHPIGWGLFELTPGGVHSLSESA